MLVRGLRSFFILGTIYMWMCLALYRIWMNSIGLQFMRHFATPSVDEQVDFFNEAVRGKNEKNCA
jgi:hypothetical protein